MTKGGKAKDAVILSYKSKAKQTKQQQKQNKTEKNGGAREKASGQTTSYGSLRTYVLIRRLHTNAGPVKSISNPNTPLGKLEGSVEPSAEKGHSKD